LFNVDVAMTLDWRIKCLILHGKNDDEILRLLRGVKFNSTIIRENKEGEEEDFTRCFT